MSMLSWNTSPCQCCLLRALQSGCHNHCPGARWGSLSPLPSMHQAPERILAEHYHDLQRKPFYPALISYMSSGPVVAMVWEGPNVVCTSRAMIGHTNSAKAAPGTIRGDFSTHVSR